MKLKIKLLAAWRVRFQLWAEGDKLWAEGDKLWAEGDKLRAEGNKLWAEGDKLWAEGDKLWAEGILEVRGNVTVEWKNDGSCVLGTGETFTEEDAQSLPAALAEAHEREAA